MFIRLLLLCAVANAVYTGDPRKPSDVPAPKEYGRDNWVSDPDHVLDDDVFNWINGLLNSDSKLKKNRYPCGWFIKPYQVGVAVVNKMHGDWVGREEEFADKVFNRWGLGYSSCNNGVLVFLSAQDKKVVINVGAGKHMQHVLSVNTRKELLNNFVKTYKSLKSTSSSPMSLALYDLVDDVTSVLVRNSDKYFGKSNKRIPYQTSLIVGWMFLFAGFSKILLFVLCTCGQKKRLYNVNGRVRRENEYHREDVIPGLRRRNVATKNAVSVSFDAKPVAEEVVKEVKDKGVVAEKNAVSATFDDNKEDVKDKKVTVTKTTTLVKTVTTTKDESKDTVEDKGVVAEKNAVSISFDDTDDENEEVTIRKDYL